MSGDGDSCSCRLWRCKKACERWRLHWNQFKATLASQVLGEFVDKTFKCKKQMHALLHLVVFLRACPSTLCMEMLRSLFGMVLAFASLLLRALKTVARVHTSQDLLDGIHTRCNLAAGHHREGLAPAPQRQAIET
eukprot:4639226-Amphidinium_carterae.1